jgi:hypothetical protein
MDVRFWLLQRSVVGGMGGGCILCCLFCWWAGREEAVGDPQIMVNDVVASHWFVQRANLDFGGALVLAEVIYGMGRAGRWPRVEVGCGAGCRRQ